MFTDLRHAFRSLRRNSGFTAVAVLTLSLGIGSTASMFTLLDSVVLSPLRYPEPERLIWIDSRVPGVGAESRWGVSVAGFFEFRTRLTTLAGIGAYSTQGYAVAGVEGADRVTGAGVTAGLLSLLGAHTEAGRLIDVEDDRPGAEAVALLGHRYWVSHFGADPDIVGRQVIVEGNPLRVIGVMASGINPPEQVVDLWMPLQLNPAAPAVNHHWLSVIGQLRPGVKLEHAQADLAQVTAGFPERFPEAYSAAFMKETAFSTAAVPLRDQVIGSSARTLWILLGVVGLVLGISAANVVSLLLVRAEGRRPELQLRATLGASFGRIARLLAAEGIVIAVLAMVLGTVLAMAAIGGLIAISPEALPRLGEVALGPATLGLCLLIAIVVGIAAGVLPAVHFKRGAAFTGLAGAPLSRIMGRHKKGTRNVLVAGQVAFAVMVLAAAALMFRSFQRLRAVDPGFEARGVLTMQLSLPYARYSSYEATTEFYRLFFERLRALPGVEVASVTSDLPLQGYHGCSAVFIEDHPLSSSENPPCVTTLIVAPGAFQALGIPVVGKAPDWHDLDAGTGAVVVSRALADRLWPGQNPIGKGIRGNGDAPPYYRVAGVTSDVRGKGLEQPATEAVYFPIRPIAGAQLWEPLHAASLVVRSGTTDPASLTAAVRGVLAELDPLIATARVATMEDVVRSSPSMARLSFMLVLLGLASATGLALSAVGIYGVISYLVSQRRAEIGLRMALGASSRNVAGLVVGQAITLAGAGLLAGLAGSLMLGRAIRTLLFEVSPADPVALVWVSCLLLSVGLLAAWLPARRAARVDPMIALRSGL